MDERFLFAPLLLVILLAFAVPLILAKYRRLGIPVIVGEIIAGILVGKSGLRLVHDRDPAIGLLAELGFVFLMFLAGMEIDFSHIGSVALHTRNRKFTMSPVVTGVMSFTLTLLLSFCVGSWLSDAGLVRSSWMMTLILSTTSLGVVMPVLKEQGLSSGRFGQTVHVSALVADFGTMVLITLVVASRSGGLVLRVLLIIALFVVFLLFVHFGRNSLARVGPIRVALRELSHTSSRIKIRAAFMIMLVFVVLAEVLGTEVILGAFLAGLIISLVRTPEDADLSHQLESIGFGFFLPIFFITVGIGFDLRSLLGSMETILLLPALLLAAVTVKVIPALVFRVSFGWRETIAAGTLLSARLSLIIAASAIGTKLGLISQGMNSAILLIAVLTVTTAPRLFVRLAPKPEPASRRPIVVVGAGELGLLVSARFRAYRERVVLVDPDHQRIRRARMQGNEVVEGRADRADDPSARVLEVAAAVVVTTTEHEWALAVCRTVRGVFGIDHVVAYVGDPSSIADYESLGVRAVNPALHRAALLVLLTRSPWAFSLLTRTDYDKEMLEIEVENLALIGKTLRELALPGDVLILALHREGELLMPQGSTRLARGDNVTIVGSIESIEEARSMFGRMV